VIDGRKGRGEGGEELKIGGGMGQKKIPPKIFLKEKGGHQQEDGKRFF